MYDISDGDEPYTVVSIHSECLLAHKSLRSALHTLFCCCICTCEDLLFSVSNRGVPCTPCSVVVFVHVKTFCSQLATEECLAHPVLLLYLYM